MSIKLRKKIIVLIAMTITVSMLAVAGKLMVDKRRDTAAVKAPELPAAKEEYTKLVKKFLQQDTAIRMAGIVSLYDGENPGVLREKSEFVSLRSGNSFYSSMSSQQSFSNGKLLVQLDTAHRLLFVTGAPDDLQQADGRQDPTGMFDRLFSDTASFKMSGIVSGDDKERSITIRSDFNPGIQRFTVYYTPVDYTLKSAEIRFWKNGRNSEDGMTGQEKVWISKIDYRVYTGNEVNVDSVINKVLLIKGKTIEPRPAYRDYRIVIK